MRKKPQKFANLHCNKHNTHHCRPLGHLARLAIILILALLALTSCSTTITLRTLVPAQVDVSGYKTIAIMSTQNKSRWSYPLFWNLHVPIVNVDDKFLLNVNLRTYLDFNVPSAVTNTATEVIYNALNTGLAYKVIPPDQTDAYVREGQARGNLRGTLMNLGIDAILKTEISNIYYDEFISQEIEYQTRTDSENNEYQRKNFYLNQIYAISISYILTDVENNKIIAAGTFSSDKQIEHTLIGYTIDSKDTFHRCTYSVFPASMLLRGQIRNFSESFRNALTPHYLSESLKFLPNKPKVESLDLAYDLVDDGQWRDALPLFASEYENSGHINAGINAAILYFSTGSPEKGIALAQEIYSKYGSNDARKVYNHLKLIYDRNNAAILQINSTEKSGSSSSNGKDLVGF